MEDYVVHYITRIQLIANEWWILVGPIKDPDHSSTFQSCINIHHLNLLTTLKIYNLLDILHYSASLIYT